MIFWPKSFLLGLYPEILSGIIFKNNGLTFIFSFYLYVFIHFPTYLTIIYLFILNFTFSQLFIPPYTVLHPLLLLSLLGAQSSQQYLPTMAFQVSAWLGISLLLKSEKATKLGEQFGQTVNSIRDISYS